VPTSTSQAATQTQAASLKIPGASSASHTLLTNVDVNRHELTELNTRLTQVEGTKRHLIKEHDAEMLEQVARKAENRESTYCRDKIEWAKDIAHAFARVTRSLQLYDLHNDAVREALSNLFTQLLDFLKANSELTYFVEPWRLLVDKQEVYSNNDREHSIAFKLFRDGIRVLTLREGLNWQELGQLLAILGMRYGGVHFFEDDLATLFWKANLKYVNAVTIEGFGIDICEEGELHPIEDLYHRMREEKVGAWFDGTMLDNLQARYEGALVASIREEQAQKIIPQLRIRPVQYRALSDHQLATIHKNTQLANLMLQMDTALNFIERVAINLEQIVGREGLHHLMRDYLYFLAAEGLAEGIEELIQRCIKWSQQSHEIGRLMSPIGQDLLATLDSREFLGRLLMPNILDENGEIPESAYRLLRWADQDRRPQILDLLQAEQSLGVKKILHNLLVALSGSDLKIFAQRLTNALPEFILEIVECLRLFRTPQSIGMMVGLLEHPHPKVQDRMIELIEELFESAQSMVFIRNVLTRLLESNEKSERVRGYKLLEKSNEQRWAAMLRRLLQAKKLTDEKEIEDVARLVSRLDKEATLPLLLEWASPPGMLSIEREWRKSLRYGAILALPEIGGPKAEGAILNMMDKCDGALHDACLSSMRELRRFQSDPHTPRKKLLWGTQPIIKVQVEESSEQTTHQYIADHREIDLSRLQDLMHKSLRHVDLKSDGSFSAQLREHGHQFIILLNMLIKNRSLYDPNNEIFSRPLKEIGLLLEKMLAQIMVVTLAGMEGQFYINDMRIRTQSGNIEDIFGELNDLFEKLQLGGITFSAPLSEAEWRLLIDLLSGHGTGTDRKDWRDIYERLAHAGISKSVEVVGRLRARLKGERQKSESRKLVAIYIDAIEALETMWQLALRGQPPNPLPIRRIINDMVDTLCSKYDTNLSVLAFEDTEEPFKTHLIQTALLSVLIGIEFGFERAQLADLGMAAFVHDIGHAVLLDPSMHHNKGWQDLNHQQAGLGLMLKHRGFHESKLKRILSIIEHHELASNPTAKSKPSIFSRIIRVADTYDTWTSLLVGGIPLCPTEALERMSSGTAQHFDPHAVQALTNRLGHYPPGTIVGMADQAIALSLGSDGSPKAFERPAVLMFVDPNGKSLSGFPIDLCDPKHQKFSIAGIITNDQVPTLNPRYELISRLWPELLEILAYYKNPQ
jgi:response regulator RpfG family c-di-GMP phosphodiesterase